MRGEPGSKAALLIESWAGFFSTCLDGVKSRSRVAVKRPIWPEADPACERGSGVRGLRVCGGVKKRGMGKTGWRTAVLLVVGCLATRGASAWAGPATRPADSDRIVVLI